MAPLLPSMLSLQRAIEKTAIDLSIGSNEAFDLMIDALCDGALYATAIFPSANGPPNSLTISPANWQMHKYNDAQLHYDFVEITTLDLIKWLRLDERGATSSEVKSGAVGRSGAPGRPTSMHLVVGEARRRINEGLVDHSSKKAFANELADWLSTKSCEVKLTAKTIANNSEITSIFRDFLRAQNLSPK